MKDLIIRGKYHDGISLSIRIEKWGEMAGVRASDTTLGLLDSEKSLNYTEPNPASPRAGADFEFVEHGHETLRSLRPWSA